jgi:hypothetical protein
MALNWHQIMEFFDVGKDMVERFGIIPSTIYNMDEKSIQLGVGKQMLVLVD